MLRKSRRCSNRRNRFQRKPIQWTLFFKGREALPAGDLPAGRSLLRFLVLGLLVFGVIYLSAVSLNILVLGTDDVDYSKHTDTIMLIHWRPLPRRLALLSIPRDTLIRLPKRGPMKINAVYAYGNALGSRDYAMAMTRASIENLLGLKIHYVVHLRYSGFIKLVDALGGVPLYVIKRMCYKDQAGGVNIDLEPGYQLLDGRQSLNYVRFRHDREGDIGRIRRQQKFLKAFMMQIMRFSQLPRTCRAFYSFIHQVEMDLSLPAAIFLAMEIRGVAGRSWRQAILPGRAVYIKGKSYWQPDALGVQKVVEDLGRPPGKKSSPAAGSQKESRVEVKAREEEKKPAPKIKPEIKAAPTPFSLPAGQQPIIRILNGCGASGVAGCLAEKLKKQKLLISADNITNAPSFDYAYTIIKTNSKNLPWARSMAAILNLDEGRIHKISDKISYPTLTLVIGEDYGELLE
ncbi:LCP family protein [bacterium]|nr:LCP family protein [bacterium]